jgi:hypothetical protein
VALGVLLLGLAVHLAFAHALAAGYGERAPSAGSLLT